MSLHELVDPSFSIRLSLTLLHSLWQVGLLTLAVWTLDRLRRKPSAERSYTLHVAALAASLAAMPPSSLVSQTERAHPKNPTAERSAHNASELRGGFPSRPVTGSRRRAGGYAAP